MGTIDTCHYCQTKKAPSPEQLYKQDLILTSVCFKHLFEIVTYYIRTESQAMTQTFRAVDMFLALDRQLSLVDEYQAIYVKLSNDAILKELEEWSIGIQKSGKAERYNCWTSNRLTQPPSNQRGSMYIYMVASTYKRERAQGVIYLLSPVESCITLYQECSSSAYLRLMRDLENRTFPKPWIYIIWSINISLTYRTLRDIKAAICNLPGEIIWITNTFTSSPPPSAWGYRSIKVYVLERAVEKNVDLLVEFEFHLADMYSLKSSEERHLGSLKVYSYFNPLDYFAPMSWRRNQLMMANLIMLTLENQLLRGSDHTLVVNYMLWTARWDDIPLDQLQMMLAQQKPEKQSQILDLQIEIAFQKARKTIVASYDDLDLPSLRRKCENPLFSLHPRKWRVDYIELLKCVRQVSGTDEARVCELANSLFRLLYSKATRCQSTDYIQVIDLAAEYRLNQGFFQQALMIQLRALKFYTYLCAKPDYTATHRLLETHVKIARILSLASQCDIRDLKVHNVILRVDGSQLDSCLDHHVGALADIWGYSSINSGIVYQGLITRAELALVQRQDTHVLDSVNPKHIIDALVRARFYSVRGELETLRAQPEAAIASLKQAEILYGDHPEGILVLARLTRLVPDPLLIAEFKTRASKLDSTSLLGRQIARFNFV